ncbi:unnamed protein product [Fraxinus pennsylvanica]|uniref:Uncharacterized protein n=1 Tax=Fraxinus pennsylvanica TaxID=56036 RepID=A0AAD2EEJ8_9LAMI|nr:unnamed protein product [Fraxinus pennsylvanica]
MECGMQPPRLYTNIVNGNNLPFTLQPSRTTTAGGLAPLDADTGEILWSTENSSNDTTHGRMGAILWSFNIGATTYGGASASYGCVIISQVYSIGLARSHPT